MSATTVATADGSSNRQHTFVLVQSHSHLAYVLRADVVVVAAVPAVALQHRASEQRTGIAEGGPKQISHEIDGATAKGLSRETQ